MPAPATAPWLMPRLKPCGALALRIARMACWVSSATAVHDQPRPVLASLDRAERAVSRGGAGRLVLALDVDHPVRGPQALESVGRTRHRRGVLDHHLSSSPYR